MESKDFIHHETAAGINSAATNSTSSFPTTPSSLSAGAVATHPLQYVDLSLDDDAEPEITSTKTVTKNWVKFDDEANDVDGNSAVAAAINENDNNKSNSNINIGSSEGMPATLAVTPATAAAATTLNKLSPPPPSHSRRSTSPSTTTNTQPEKTMNKHSAAVAPVQRQTISSSTTTTEAEIAPAVLTTESTHVNLNASGKTQQQQQHQHHQHQQHKPKAMTSSQVLGNNSSNSNAGHAALGGHHNNNNGNTSGAAATGSGSGSNKAQSVTIPVETAPPMRTIELSTGRIREGFANGDVIVTLLPANTKWPWITPAIFRPELVPEELMAQGLTLTVEEYVNAMETLVNDYRFTVYNICYKRILVCWIIFAFAVLLTLLFSGLQGVALFSLGVGWLFLNAAAIFLCMWMKLRLSRGLEKCLARVNKQLMRHKILLILDDRGRISCHKVNLCFLYFDATQCITYLNEFLEHTEQNGGEAIKAGWEAKLDIDVNDIVIQGNNPVRLSRKQERGNQLYLRYGSRWGMEALRGQCDVTPLDPGRHCGQFQCPCQYIKQHLQYKPRGKFKFMNFIYWVMASERYEY